MDSPTKSSRTPKTPLFPLSPGRVNRVASGTDSTTSNASVDRKHRPPPPQSPSLPDFNLHGSKHLDLSNRDVQGIVARFDALDIKDHAELRRKDVAALKRAQMGREEAEAELRKAREENRKMKKEAEESAERERRLSKRLEIVSDELSHEKDIRATGISKYEREMRTARKEAFRSSSAMVKMQEDLKATRASLNKVRTDLDTEKGRSRQREQEAFSAQYELVGAQEALQKETERCKVIESERDALKTQLKEEEVARVAAEGMIALPKPSAVSEDDEFASPRKQKTPSGRTQKQDAMVTCLQTELQDLKEEIDGLQYSKDEAEAQIDFMKMECQFRCCSCRVAENSGERFMQDASLAEVMGHIRPESRFAFEPRPDVIMSEPPARPVPEGVVPSRPTTPAPAQELAPEEEEQEDVIFSPQSGTFRRSSGAQQLSSGPATTEESTQEIKTVASENVTTHRPTVYINSNGHIHEEEHQPRRRTRHSVKQESQSLDDTVVHIPSEEADEELKDPANEPLPEDADADLDMSSPTKTADDSDFDGAASDNDNVEDEEDFLIQSPTAHIAATTITTTIPLALSSPTKPKPTPASSTLTAQTRTPSRPASRTATHDFAGPLPNNDKENAAPITPGTAVPTPAPSTPWTPLAETGLTREEAIERLRARRELERATVQAHATANTSANSKTPQRAASHGSAKRPVTPGRRDISAPEVRSGRR